jgi:hypothetical protein
MELDERKGAGPARTENGTKFEILQGVSKVLEAFVFEIYSKSLGAEKKITARLKLRF